MFIYVTCAAGAETSNSRYSTAPRGRSRTFTHVQHILFWLYLFFTEGIITFFDAHLYLRVGTPAWIETRHYVLPWCRGALSYVLLCCWLLTARCSSRPLFSVCCVLGCVRAVFLCLLFLQIADVDVFFLCFIGYWCIFLR